MRRGRDRGREHVMSARSSLFARIRDAALALGQSKTCLSR
jgi:hypothetical protein